MYREECSSCKSSSFYSWYFFLITVQKVFYSPSEVDCSALKFLRFPFPVYSQRVHYKSFQLMPGDRIVEVWNCNERFVKGCLSWPAIVCEVVSHDERNHSPKKVIRHFQKFFIFQIIEQVENGKPLKRRRKSPVFLGHSVVGSSAIWTFAPNHSLAYMLADQGIIRGKFDQN